MNRLKKYLFKTYSSTFFPIFSVLFIITSVVFIIKIARLTSVIQIDVVELLIMYSFTLPKILFYILPICIFISLVLTISKLSSEYELMVINSFGLNPLKIVKLFIPHIIVVTILLLIISMVLVPKSNLLNLQFIEDKKAQAQFNISPSEFGQKFGDWFIYVNDKNVEQNSYEDIVLFKTTENKTNFIIAQNAKPSSNQQANISLILNQGNALNIEKNIQQVNFNTMIINNSIKEVKVLDTFDDLIFYWKKIYTNSSYKEDFIFNILYSIFILISAFMIITIGFFNPRYEKNRSTIFGIVLSILYISITHKLSKTYGLYILIIFPSLWLIGSYYFYKTKIKAYY